MLRHFSLLFPGCTFKASTLITSTHKCPYCGYTTVHKHNIGRHITAMHKKHKFAKCNVCSYESSYRDNMTRHLRAVHKFNVVISELYKHMTLQSDDGQGFSPGTI